MNGYRIYFITRIRQNVLRSKRAWDKAFDDKINESESAHIIYDTKIDKKAADLKVMVCTGGISFQLLRCQGPE